MKKLSLHRETLQSLSERASEQVAGGNYISAASGCRTCTAGAATCFCPNTGHAPCSLYSGCCPIG